MRVLLVEDDVMIAHAVEQALKDATYAVDVVYDGQSALIPLGANHYDVLLLDLGLPRLSGFEVLRHIRTKKINISVIILTAKDTIEDRIRGLDEGADDYLLKPFDMPELLARLRAVIRRYGGSASPILTNGVVSLDPVSREAHIGDRAVRLSAREFGLLQSLLLRPGAILSRQDLEDHIYGWNEEIESNVVEYLIHSIRKKLGNTVIINVRGLGWAVSKPS